MKKSKKSKFNFTVLAIALLVIIGVASISYYAWAKYIAKVDGQTTADVAEFNFSLTDGTVQESGKVLFAITRNDGNTKVADNMLAPGTSGEFKIGVDASRFTNLFRISNRY